MMVWVPLPAMVSAKDAGLVDVEHDDRDLVLARQRDRRGVHHLQVLLQHVHVGERVVALGGLVLARIGRIDAVDLGALQHRIEAHLGGAQGGGGVGGEERIAGAGGEDHHPALLHVAGGAAADIGLADGGHRNGRLYTGLQPLPLQGALHGQCIDHRGQHAHVVAAGAVHARGGGRHAAEDVAAADHQADLHAHVVHGLDLLGDHADHLGVEAIFPLAHQPLARELQQDAAIAWSRRHSGASVDVLGRRGHT